MLEKLRARLRRAQPPNFVAGDAAVLGPGYPALELEGGVATEQMWLPGADEMQDSGQPRP